MASDLPSPDDNAKPKDYYAKFSVCLISTRSAFVTYILLSQTRTTYSKHTEWVFPSGLSYSLDQRKSALVKMLPRPL